MSQPVGASPVCSVWIDGVRMADGQPTDPELDPTVLTDLSVVWGRGNNLDQPAPSTATFEVMDLAGGMAFASKLHIGGRVDVRTDATIYPDPTLEILTDGGFETGTQTWLATNGTARRDLTTPHAGTRSLRIAPTNGTKLTTIDLPPAPFSSNPSAWNGIPRAVAGQRWAHSAWVQLASDLGTLKQKVTIRPLAYSNPNGKSPVVISAPLVWGPGGPAGWTQHSGTFLPPQDAWIGLRIEIYPSGPAWSDVAPAVTWASLLGTAGVTTSLITNPAPASSASWATNDGTKWKATYANGEISVETLITGNYAASLWGLGMNNPGNPILDPAKNYQRAVEIWVDTDATVPLTTNGGFGSSGPYPLKANTWTRVAEQFTGLGVAKYVMNLYVSILNVTLGTHVKLRHTQLIENPSGQTQPYFDGDTPDTTGRDYAWTGTAHASTSTLTAQAGPTWDSLSVIRLDDVSVLAPTGGVAMAALVFSGRITDLDARYDLGVGGTVVKVIAADNTAELAQRYVGDAPWTASTLATRFASIISASKQSITYTVASTVGSQQVTYRDVDSRPALQLLQELSASVAGVLWTATSLVTGPVLHLDDVNARPAMRQLYFDGTKIRIKMVSPVPASGVTVSACSFDLDPVRWHQTNEDDSTEVAVTWLEQLTDPGPPVTQTPTQRLVLATDPVAENATGKRRIAVTTQLATEAGGQATANSILARNRTPGWRISGLRWQLNPYEMLSPDDLDIIMRILDGTTRMGLPMVVTELPGWTPIAKDSNLAVFLEGGRFTNTDGYWTFELLVSDASSQGQAAVAWQDQPSAWLWNQYASDIEWSELTGVTI